MTLVFSVYNVAELLKQKKREVTVVNCRVLPLPKM